MGIRTKGIKVIDKMVGKFQGIVEGLDQGISLCNVEMGENDSKIETLKKKNDNISTSKSQAEVFRDNLKSLLSGKKSNKKKD